MGKRVRVKREKIPNLNLRKLRDPSETMAKILGIVVPLVLYIAMIAITQAVRPLRKISFDLLAWLILGAILILVNAAAGKGKLAKAYPGSKVAGSKHTEIRLKLNRLCRLLEIKKVPDTYVIDSDRAAATVRGMLSPYLIISSRLLSLLSDQEFEALLGVLLGHCKMGNVFWRTFIHVLRDGNGFMKLICAPYLLMVSLLGQYLEISHFSADRIALLLLEGDYHLLSRTVLKTIARSSASISEEEATALDQFLAKSGVEASAADVEHQYILGRMVRDIAGLRDRLDNIKQSNELPVFQEQLAVIRRRTEMLQPAARG